jgi:hypothetical protein
MAKETYVPAKVKLTHDDNGSPVIKLVFPTRKAAKQVADHLTKPTP